MRKAALVWRVCAVVVGCSARSAWAQPATGAPPPPIEESPDPNEPARPEPPPAPPPPPLGFAPEVAPVAVKPAATSPPPSTAPPFGYFRDARGRVMQTQFDMNRRFWIGGGWSPLWSDAERTTARRGQLEIGMRRERVSDDGRWRGRFRLIEGEALMQPLEARGSVFRYDESRETETPVLRISTFWPRPVRHDVYLNLGFWGEVLGVEVRPRGSEGESNVRFAGLGGTWDLWHSRDLEDYLRLRTGTALDNRLGDAGDGDGGGVAVTPLARLEMDSLIDRGGFHRLTGDVGIETPIFMEPKIDRKLRRRFSGSLGYEVIFMAVNDQPITMRVAGNAGYRDDLAMIAAHGWDVGGAVGLRVNLWAPPPNDPNVPPPTKPAATPATQPPAVP
jgi:hypothetical protein